MDETPIEAALRAGPPEEDAHAPDAAVFEPGPIAALIAPAPVGGARSASSRSSWSPLALGVAAIVLVAVAAFGGARAGRAEVPAGATGVPSPSPVLVPAVIAPELRGAYGDLVLPGSWMVCAADAVVACQTLPWTTPSTALILEHPIVDPGRPTSVRGRHLVVGAWFDPAHLPTVYLIPVGGASSEIWRPLVSVPMGGGGLLVDLPNVAPGHYLIALHSDELGAAGDYEVSGIEVQAP